MSVTILLDGTSDASREDLGGKAWSLNAMRALGIDVPPAFVLPTSQCRRYAENGGLDDGVREAVVAGVRSLEDQLGRRFGDAAAPLLLSVRSGAALSMPGMMDTVLNLGTTEAVRDGLAAMAGEAYADDTRRRFLTQYRSVIGTETVPDDPWEQLFAAVAAVFESWGSDRAVAYRRHHGLDDAAGTAVTVQAMVFGNLDDSSGTGVLFSRDPSTGENTVFGEWLPRGQGEDVVSGSVDPLPLAELAATNPDAHARLMEWTDLLERTHTDVQDIEFTIESGRLWLLQSRAAKRSARAAVRCAVAMVDEGLLTPAEAVARVSADQIDQVEEHAGVAEVDADPVATGLATSPGRATGIVVTDADDAEDRSEDGEAVVLATPTTDPDDVHGMIAAVAIITELGGATSHAAVVSRELGRPCVVGCGVGTVTSLAGQVVTVDGSTGRVWLGDHTAAAARTTDPDVERLRAWAAAPGTAGA